MEITHCPSCGSSHIEKVEGTVSRDFDGETYSVPGVTYYACPECGERVYEPETARALQAASPAFRGQLSAH